MDKRLKPNRLRNRKLSNWNPEGYKINVSDNEQDDAEVKDDISDTVEEVHAMETVNNVKQSATKGPKGRKMVNAGSARIDPLLIAKTHMNMVNRTQRNVLDKGQQKKRVRQTPPIMTLNLQDF